MVRLHVFNAEQVMDVARELAEVSAEKYYIQERLHGNTARAFWNHHRNYGDKFISRAERYGRIYVHIDGDVRRALNLVAIGPLQNPNQQVNLGKIMLDGRDCNTTLFDRLNLARDASEEDVKRALWKLFCDNFEKGTSAGFSRVLTQAVRRISYTNKAIEVIESYNEGCKTDLNQGVANVLAFYRDYFARREEFAEDISKTLNVEFSKAFSQFFFALYRNR